MCCIDVDSALLGLLASTLPWVEGPSMWSTATSWQGNEQGEVETVMMSGIRKITKLLPFSRGVSAIITVEQKDSVCIA